ncbi:hypothetical protein [Virgisporangium aurantiacum]|uniref:Uncharacterized protein n=1 Tax=Virgisporangium aurantiacum TaxID=175570 RepID=A0A8J3ZHU2_9ACTN|nr:hypothetical protein [Virgisporangium aurantiacum]GIJ64474.1 hypothetical protein Vau01_119900 [Virgisporangium aurantiacum]
MNPITSRCLGREPVGLLYVGDVQALRRADSVRFDTRETQSGLDAWIEADLFPPSVAEPRIYTATEQRLFPEADASDRRRRIAVGADIAGFDDQQRWHDRHLPGTTAYALISPARLDEVWRSIAAFVRVGDVLRLYWRADNTIDWLEDPRLHRDELSIAVHRGRRRWMFLLDVQIRPEPVRMITRT